jgi:hypothetical protein
MAAKDGSVNIGPGTFPAGTKVKLLERVGDAEYAKGAKSASIDKDGTASFSGLEPGRQFWLQGEDEHGRPVTVAATAKGPNEGPRLPARNPEDVRNELRDRALDQGAANAAPVEGMRSSAQQAPKSPDLAQRNRETMESAKRTAEALAKQDLVGAQVDRLAAAQAGLVTTVDGSGAAQIVAKPSKAASGSSGSSGGSSDAAARKRSAASKKAAATRKRNAARRARSSSSSSKSGKKG